MTVLDERQAGRVLLLVLVSCAVLLLGTLGIGMFPTVASALGLRASVAPAYSEGDVVDLPADVYQDSSFTVIAFARSDCPVCRESQPALRAIARSVELDPSVRMVLVATTPESERGDEIFFGGQVGLPPANVISVSAESLRLKWVPSLLLVDRTGRVLKVHEGRVDASVGADWVGALGRVVKG